MHDSEPTRSPNSATPVATSAVLRAAAVALALFAAIITVAPIDAEAQTAPAPTSCWNFDANLSSTNPAYNATVGNQAAGAGTNDAGITATNPSPAGGSSLLLDGDGDYLWVGNPLPATGSYTKTMWVRRAGANVDNQWENLYTSGDPGGAHALAVDPNNGNNILVWHRGGSGPGIESQSTGQVLATDAWVHVAVVYNTSSNSVLTYYNGSLVDTRTPVGTLGTITNADTIGSYAGMQSWFNGQLDDVCIYSTALTTPQVAAIAQPSPPTVCTFSGAGGAIPDNDPVTGLALDIPITHNATIQSLELVVSGITHTKVGDLTMVLGSPDPNLFVSVMNEPNNGDTSNLGGTYTFGDTGTSFFTAAAAAGDNDVIPPATYRASTSVNDAEDLDSQFIGMSTAGTWRLTINDNLPANVGSVTGIALKITVDSGGCPAAASGYVPLPPARILDSRNGTGGYGTAWGAGVQRSVTVTGVGGVPATGVSAVALQVTSVSPTADSFLTVWPTGTRPVAASKNYGITVGGPLGHAALTNDLLIVPVHSDGTVQFYNNAGSVDLVADVVGYFSATAGDAYSPLSPARILDSRNGTGGYGTAWGAGVQRSVTVTGVGGVPATGVSAVALQVTSVSPTADSFLTVWPTGTRPVAASKNYGITVGGPLGHAALTNDLLIVPVHSDGTVQFYNNAGSVDLVADVVGYFSPAATAKFMPLSPMRILDSRNGTGGHATPWGSGSQRAVTVSGVGGVPAGAGAVVVHVTSVSPTSDSFLTVWPTGTRPVAASKNYGTTLGGPLGHTALTNDLLIVPVGPGGTVQFYNNSGAVDLVVDVIGYYQ